MTTSPDLYASDAGTAAAARPTILEYALPAKRRRPNWPLWFAAAYVGLQVALLFLGATPARAALRIGAFSLSLVMLVLLPPGRRGRHPAVWLLPLVMLALVPGLFMPGQSSLMAAVAGATIYLAVLSPLLWVSNGKLDRAGFRHVILLLWAFNTLSATVGVLQVYYPGMFQATLSSVIQEKGVEYIGSLTIQLANGSRALRPMGLTDQPGGAATGGLYAILFGVGLMFTERRWPMRVLAGAGMVIGLFVIYLTQVRVTLVMAGLGMAVLGATFVWRGDLRRASILAAVVLAVALVGTAWAFAIGGDETAKRFSTLVESHPGDVYSDNRGWFLQDAFGTQLVEHPFGAGLGRWGMINYYFGNPNDMIWAEIMWTGWIYDGGVPLMTLYTVIVAVAVAVTWRIGTARGGGNLPIWGAVVLAYNLAAVAATFDGPVFGSQAGLELWFLNACLFNAWVNRPAPAKRPAATPPPEPTATAAAPAVVGA